MQINNFFQMNDWEISKFLDVIFFLQFILLALLALSATGLNVPFLREIFSLVYLLFVPGILLIRILKLHKLGSVETILYSVGLSIFILMFLGLVLTLLYFIFGVPELFSILPLTVTITITVIILSVIAYYRDGDYADPDYLNTTDILAPSTLAVLLIPFISIFGAYIMNLYGNNSLLVVFILLLGFIVILFAYDKIPRKLYPLLVFVMGVSILFHTSLISNYISGWDIQSEYSIAKLVVDNGYWLYRFNDVVNGMLTVSFLAPIVSIISGIDLEWVFKTVYPALFALVPLGLYCIFKKQTNHKIAFLSSFIFISFFALYLEMISIARQEIGEIFLILLVMVMISDQLDYIRRSFLFLIFGMALVLSHYGLSYYFMFALFLVYLLLILIRNHKIRNLTNYLSKKVFRSEVFQNPVSDNSKIITLTFIGFFIFFIMTWYLITSLSSAFNTLLYILYLMIKTSTAQFMNPSVVQSVAVLQADYNSPLHNISKYINILVQVFLGLGVLTLVFYRRYQMKKEYLAFIVISALILIASLVMPYLSGAFNSERLYQILLIFLAPAIVVGAMATLDFVNTNIINRIYKSGIKDFKGKSLRLISVFFVVYLFFNTGMIYSLADDNSNSIAFNNTLDTAVYNEMEITSLNWLEIKSKYLSVSYDNIIPGNGDQLIGDDYRKPVFNKYGFFGSYISNSTNTSDLNILNYNLTLQFPEKDNIFFFFGTNNLKNDTFTIYRKPGSASAGVSYVDARNLFNSQDLIYDNGGARIYRWIKVFYQ